MINSEKLQKILSRVGIGSRRAMEQAINDGRVSVNGKIAKLGDRAVATDVIRFDGRVVDHRNSLVKSAVTKIRRVVRPFTTVFLRSTADAGSISAVSTLTLQVCCCLPMTVNLPTA